MNNKIKYFKQDDRLSFIIFKTSINYFYHWPKNNNRLFSSIIARHIYNREMWY